MCAHPILIFICCHNSDVSYDTSLNMWRLGFVTPLCKIFFKEMKVYKNKMCLSPQRSSPVCYMQMLCNLFLNVVNFL